MLNLVKADLYRMLHQKSFYITLSLELFFYFLVISFDGVSSNTPYAMFNNHVNTVIEFLYYVPKSAVFVTGLLLYGAILHSEVYSSKCVSTIYPIYIRKSQIIAAQWITNLMIYMMTLGSIILMAMVASIWLPNAFGSIQILDYMIYALIQGCFFAAMMSLVQMVAHVIRNTTVTIIFAICLGTSLVFVACMGLVIFLKFGAEFLQYTLYVSSGTLPYMFTLEGYMTPILVCFCFTIMSSLISVLCLQKRDLS